MKFNSILTPLVAAFLSFAGCSLRHSWDESYTYVSVVEEISKSKRIVNVVFGPKESVEISSGRLTLNQLIDDVLRKNGICQKSWLRTGKDGGTMTGMTMISIECND